MTGFEIERLPFVDEQVQAWAKAHPKAANWPVVYTLNGGGDVYIGESLNMASRAKQHRAAPEKRHLESMRVVMDPKFNKSVCLDLESYLIGLFSGEGKYRVLNRNDGIIDADYYDRERYQGTFREIFEQLRDDGLFERSIPEIRNSDLFKLSPFKALTHEQAIAVEDILEGLFADLGSERRTTSVIQGAPGTGKTIVAIYLIKLLRDIADRPRTEDLDRDSMFAEFFAEGYADVIAGRRIGFVIPQQSLRTSVQRVFKKTPGLHPGMVLTPFQVGNSEHDFDILVVDEAHRLNQRANQPSGPKNKQFQQITERLFGFDDASKTQLDWIQAKAKHVILMLDRAQSVRPADLPAATTAALVDEARRDDRLYPLTSQMRVAAGEDYVGFTRALLGDDPPAPTSFRDYDLRVFDDLGAMRREIRKRDDEVGLARLVAGYAWPWASKKDPTAYDIELDGERMRWNVTATDWINSPTSRDEVGSIHTVQGYDLNYAGVIIGPEVSLAPDGRVQFVRERYFDKKGAENNPKLGIVYSDADLLEFVRNVYSVLLTRGMRGTYVYVVDPALRERLRTTIATVDGR
ncbi:DUF2075 domain-containing protein [Agrococcus jejuensis]|uniref:Schlafen group 3-like DNA/RNA helicase domain-containing protein n=1 Tax=Agrococcus jejuensis TaxID=399736 RepID=A0A1G8CG89_9MICO|nr:DUF2075 domain-containing protein [Agrococcus jejuensis]SDH44422.1 hypothetical protein SAMN04489720_1280 [Agrococcus jejuensis]